MIDRVQAQLEAIYGLEHGHRASAFVVGPEQARELGATGRADEELLLRQEDGELCVALYFAPELLKRLQRFDDLPTAYFLDGNLGSYCQLAEGVSHFLYVVNAAEQDRQVSLLEMEAQAEVDKFASCVLSRWADGEEWARDLAHRLFDDLALRPGLTEPERWRYAEANRLARNYCGRMLRYISERRMDSLLSELRHSYRMGAEAKLQYLSRAA
jgi:hypothetical protein